MTTKWGILATGRIAYTFAEALKSAVKSKLVAVASRTAENANRMAETYQVNAHDGYAELLQNPEVDAVYISTPHPQHAEWCIAALQAGKAVLCEKPLGINHAQVMAMTHTAANEGRFLMEAFMYRAHPQTLRVQALIAQGAIGELRHIDAKFAYRAPFNADSRLFANELGGGGILDVGCYPMSLARLLAGEPLAIHAHGHVGETGVDEWSAAQVSFPGGVTAQIATAVRVNMDNSATIYGTHGHLHIARPWQPGDEQGRWAFTLHRNDGQTTTESGQAPPIYAIEADAVAEALQQGETQCTHMSWQDSLGNALALDQWRQNLGQQYQAESATAAPPRYFPSAPPAAPDLARTRVPFLDKPISRLVMGCDNQPSMSHAALMWDYFVDRGGNCFDTAYVYGRGSMEQLLGQWQRTRGIREDVVIVGKGAHTPNCFPQAIGEELTVSLERLQTDYVDIYFMHRDNLDVPVDEFIDALNREMNAGRVRAFGVSNWSLERISAANQYAADAGLTGISAISNNFSLAIMEKPIWPGVHSATNDAFTTYLEDTHTLLMPWSSQARGFFTPWAESVMQQIQTRNHTQTGAGLAATTMEPTAAELAEVWFSDRNFARRQRAAELAERHGVNLIEIALAYVLRQAFPVTPLVGPRSLSELDSCIRGANVELSTQEVQYLAGG